MTAVVISTQTVSTEDTTQLIQLQFFVKDENPSEFDQLEVWRSQSGSGGPFEELTAARYLPAVLPVGALPEPDSPVTGPAVALDDRALQLRVGDVELEVLFSGSDPITYASAASQIQAQGLGLLDSWVDSNGALVVATMIVGTGADLEVVGGDAAPQLGLVVGSIAFGRAPRVVLVEGQASYQFSDLRGKKSYYYQTRFRNSSTGAVGEFSLPVPADQPHGVLPSDLVCGQVDLVDPSGKPLQYMAVQVSADFTGKNVSGKTVAGGPLLKKTDKRGHAEFTLVRGQTVVVAIAGTGLNRIIEVPTDPTVFVFNLLDPKVSKSDDLFKVAVPDIVVAERRTL